MIFKGRKSNTIGRTTSLTNTLNQHAKKTLVLALSLGTCTIVFNTLNVNGNSLNDIVADTDLDRQITVRGDTDHLKISTGLDQAIEDVNKVHSFIVRANDFQRLLHELASIDLVPTHQLHVIDSVAVDMTKAQLQLLQQRIEVTVSANHAVKTAAVATTSQSNVTLEQLQFQPLSVTANFVGANISHNNGNYGAAVTVGFLDTGLDHFNGNALDTWGYDKYWGTYDAVNDIAYNHLREQNGHGSHVTSVAGNSEYDMYGRLYGIAPNALTVGIKAFDQYGQGSYADVIRGIQWAIDYKDTINLRILNMSFSGPVQSYYWEDPLNQAIMNAWQAGIVVVASAGNAGPDPMTIGVPGNVPYVITVGAMTDNYTATNSSDDRLAIFSSSGPTIEGFVKPEIIAPGGHISGIMATDTYIVTNHPEFSDGGGYFQMSGTSHAAAVISGVAALILTDDPSLSADDVKCRIMAGAKSAINSLNQSAYSVFQQGAGLVDVQASLNSTTTGCANIGLDIAQDIAGTTHFRGPAKVDKNGDFYVEGVAGNTWDIPQSMVSTESDRWRSSIKNDSDYTWQSTFDTSSGNLWLLSDSMELKQSEQSEFEDGTDFLLRNQSLIINSGNLWIGSGNLWIGSGNLWIGSTTTSTIEVNAWVEQQ